MRLAPVTTHSAGLARWLLCIALAVGAAALAPLAAHAQAAMPRTAHAHAATPRTAHAHAATPRTAPSPAPAPRSALDQTLADAQWPAAVRAALAAADVPLQAMAVALMPAAHAGPSWLHQADLAMQPGSTMKLVTSVVALDRLGPNHRGFTEVLSAASQDGDVLRGDLVLRGGADPELGLPQLWALLAELRYQGIREITGDIVLDRQLFRPARPDLGQPPFDERPERPYNVIPDALHLNGSLMSMELSSLSGKVSARLLPPLPGLELDASELQLTDRPCRDWDDDWQSPPRIVQAEGSTRIVLRGGFAKACTQRVERQLLDRNLQAEQQLRHVWQQLGGQWSGRVRDEASPSGARLLARRWSRPWGEVLRPMNKWSDNALTRLLYLSLGLQGMASDALASTAELAQREVLRWFAEQRINASGLVLDNGSGLSRSERLTARQLALMLKVAHGSRYAPELLMSLPVVGSDGTMRNRLKTGPATGLARLKTGTLRNVVALAGYVPDSDGRLWVMAAIINHDNASKSRPALDALVDWVAGGGLAAPAAPARPPRAMAKP